MEGIMRILIVSIVVFFLAPPAQAVPIATGSHLAGIQVVSGPEELPVRAVTFAQSRTLLDIDIDTSGSGEAQGQLKPLGDDSLVFAADASVPGPAGRAVVTARGETLITLTNTGPEALENLEVRFLAAIGRIAALVDDPAQESALWRSLFIASVPEVGPCFDRDDSCALASDDVSLPSPVGVRELGPDDTFRPVTFLSTLASGESRSFYLTVQARAEVMRVLEPSNLALLIVSLVGLGLPRCRTHRNASGFQVSKCGAHPSRFEAASGPPRG